MDAVAEMDIMDRAGEIFSRAVDLWGVDAQLNQTVEELAELIVAINHFRRRRASPWRLAEEVADTMIMVGQLVHIMDEEIGNGEMSRLVAMHEQAKMKSVLERIERGEVSRLAELESEIQDIMAGEEE